MAKPIRALRTLVPQETFGDVLLRDGTFTEDDHLITRGFLRKQLINAQNKITSDLYTVLPRKLREAIERDSFIRKLISDIAFATDINMDKFTQALVATLNAQEQDVLLAIEQVVVLLINSSEDTKNAIENTVINIVQNNTEIRNFLSNFVRRMLLSDTRSVEIIREHMVHMATSDAEFRAQIKALIILILSTGETDSIFKAKLLHMVDDDENVQDALRQFVIKDSDIEQYIIELIKMYSDKPDDPSHSLLTGDYDYTAVDEAGRPVQIVFFDGQIVTFNYREDGQIDYMITAGFKVRYRYNNKNHFIGIETKAMDASARKANDTNNVLTTDYTYTSLASDGQPNTMVYTDDQVVEFTYREDGQLDHYTTMGCTVRMSYDQNGHFNGKETIGNDESLGYDEKMMLLPDFTIPTMDRGGNPLQIVYTDGSVASFVYRPDGQIRYYTYNGYRVTYKYNDEGFFVGKKTSKITWKDQFDMPFEDDASGYLTPGYTYTILDDNDRPLEIEYANGQVVSIVYRDDGRIDHVDTLGYRMTYKYNENDKFIGVLSAVV